MNLEVEGLFEETKPVLKKIIDAGFEAYFVGGSVRDRLLDLPVNDVDIATSAQPEEIKKIFKRTVDIGIEHGTVLVIEGQNQYEITTFRTESTYRDFRRPDSVIFVRSLTEDLKRRDFTMNAIAMDIEGNIIDPFNGITDLKAGIIRAVGTPHERFNEDALRMMRAVRFAGQLNFEIEADTLLSIKENAKLLKKIAVERIQIEFEKLLVSGWSARGLEALVQTKLYLYCPELATKKGALVSLINQSTPFANARQAWSFLIYKIAYYFPGENFDGNHFLRQWKLSNKMIGEVTIIVRALKKRLESDDINPWYVFQLGEKFALEVEDLMLHLQDTAEHEAVKTVYQELPIKHRDELAVSGHDFMNLTTARPGPWLGEALEITLKMIVKQDLNNDKEAIVNWLKENNYIPLT